MPLLLAAALGAGSSAPRLAAQDAPVTVIRAGNVITVAGSELRNGMIVLRDGKIENVGLGLETPLNARIIDARDRTVMPGLINPYTRYGLPGYKRTEVHGNWSVAEEWFPSPAAYDELLDAGFTVLALYPAGEGVPGRAIVVRTAGQPDQRLLVSPSYLRVTPDKKTLRGALEKAQAEIDKVAKAREEFEKKAADKRNADAKPAEAAKPGTAPTQPTTTQPTTQPATQPAFQPPPIDPSVQVLVDLIQKKAGVFALLELNNASDYAHQAELLERFDIARAFRARNVADSDLAYVVAQLGEKKPRVILLPVLGRVPNSMQRQHLVRLFDRAGCEISMTPLDDSAREHARLLGRLGGLVRDGWTREAALQSVTLHPARLLGLEPRCGSIEKGKDSDLIFLDGDPLDPRTLVRAVMVGGEIVHRQDRPDGAPAREIGESR